MLLALEPIQHSEKTINENHFGIPFAHQASDGIVSSDAGEVIPFA